MNKFEAGRKYSCNSICDNNCVWTFSITRRTVKSVWFVNDEGVEKRAAVKVHNDAEFIMPLGHYSMAPILRATSIVDEVDALVEECRARFSNVERISVDACVKLLSLLDNAPTEALIKIVKARIKFCWMPAARRLADRGYDRDSIERLAFWQDLKRA